MAVAVVFAVGYWSLTCVRVVKLGGFTYIVDLDPDRERGDLAAGEIARVRGLFNVAEECYQDALRANPNSADAHGGLAISRYANSDYADAWSEAHLCQQNGGTLPPDFLAALSERMPEPQ